MRLDTEANHVRVVRLLERLEWGGTYGNECCPLCDCSEPDCGHATGNGTPSAESAHSDDCELARVLRQLREPVTQKRFLQMSGFLALFYLGKEVGGAGYSRVAVTLGEAQKIAFPQPASTWGPATEARLMSAPTGGISLYEGLEMPFPWSRGAPIEAGARVGVDLPEIAITGEL